MAKTISINLSPRTGMQVGEMIKNLPLPSTLKPTDVINIVVKNPSKARVEIASLAAMIQYSCNLVLSQHLHDVHFDFSHIKAPFSWPQGQSVREIITDETRGPLALDLATEGCRVTIFRQKDHIQRDCWYDELKRWRKDIPQRFHLFMNELVENVSAHAKLEDDRFCFTVALLFGPNKKLFYFVADNGVGLRGSLNEAIIPEAKSVAARACALSLTRPQFSSKGIDRGHQGVGLFITSELTQMNRGYLEILSGRQQFEQLPDNTVMRIRGVSSWNGTIVHGALNLDREFNYRAAMKRFDDPDSLTSDRFLICHIHLNVYGQRALRTRELCEEIIRDLEVAVERSTKLILDFNEIEEISQAFRGFLRQFVVKHKAVRIMIMIPTDADDEMREDLEDLIELAAKNNTED